MPSQPPSHTAATPALQIMEPLCAVFRRHLKSVGQKYTPERAQVLDAIIGLDDLFQADHLIEEMKRAGHRVSKATIYRTIKLLQEAGIIQQVLVNSEHAHYQLAYGQRPRDLLILVDTDEVIPIDVPELVAIRDRICKQHNITPQGHRLQIFATRHAVAPPNPPSSPAPR
ncbi:MAG: Fur family transcriptional regulator [Phycisphaerales bacterium]